MPQRTPRENGKMTNKQPDDIEAQINAEIERELAADRARRREELAYRARRKLEMEHLDRVNARAPIEGPLAGLTPEQHAARQEAMVAAARRTYREMDEANMRWAEREAAERKAEAARPRRASIGPGSEGFRFKRPGS
jgi:hypothetical protein